MGPGGSPCGPRSRAGEGGSGPWFFPLLSVFFSWLSLARSALALPCVFSAKGVTLGRGRALQIGKISGVKGETCVALGPGVVEVQGPRRWRPVPWEEASPEWWAAGQPWARGERRRLTGGVCGWTG